MVSNGKLHARVIRGTVNKGEAATAESIVTNELIPALAQMAGYEGCDLLMKDDRFDLITWWSACPGGTAEMIEQMYQEQFGRFSNVVQHVAEHVRYVRRVHHRMGT